MELLDFTPDALDDWQAFVANHPLASYGHLATQFSLAQASGIQNTSLIVREGGHVAGVLPLFLTEDRALRGMKVRALASGAFFPAGPLVSARLQGKAEARVLELLLDGARRRAESLRADRLSITHPNIVGDRPSIEHFSYSPLLHYGYQARTGIGLVVDLAQSDENLAAGRRSGCRQSISKALAAVQVRPIRTHEEWAECRDLNHQTLGRLAFSDAQLTSIWNDFVEPGSATAHAAYAEDRMVAVTVRIQHGRSAYYWIGLSRRPAVPGAGHLTLWTSILDARERGCRYFELGSLDFQNPKNVGISQFKQSFGGRPYQIISAELDLKPVKTAALALGTALIAATRQWRERRQQAPLRSNPGRPAVERASAASEPSEERKSSRAATAHAGS